MSDCTTDLMGLDLENLFLEQIQVSPPVACSVQLCRPADSVDRALMPPYVCVFHSLQLTDVNLWAVDGVRVESEDHSVYGAVL